MEQVKSLVFILPSEVWQVIVFSHIPHLYRKFTWTKHWTTPFSITEACERLFCPNKGEMQCKKSMNRGGNTVWFLYTHLTWVFHFIRISHTIHAHNNATMTYHVAIQIQRLTKDHAAQWTSTYGIYILNKDGLLKKAIKYKHITTTRATTIIECDKQFMILCKFIRLSSLYCWGYLEQSDGHRETIIPFWHETIRTIHDAVPW